MDSCQPGLSESPPKPPDYGLKARVLDHAVGGMPLDRARDDVGARVQAVNGEDHGFAGGEVVALREDVIGISADHQAMFCWATTSLPAPAFLRKNTTVPAEAAFNQPRNVHPNGHAASPR